MKKILLLIFLIPFVSTSQIEGEWHTSFIIMGTPGRMDMKIQTAQSTSIILSDPDGTFGETKMDESSVEGNEISFSWKAIGLAFEGVYSSEENEIKGEMSQRGMTWDLIFTKEEQERKSILRPQEPAPPFSYDIEELKIKNDDIVLGATLTLPKNFSENTRIVVLASGSGPQNRNCEIMGHKPFWVIADHLAKNGIACLRFDDRSMGESTGKFNETNLQEFGSDVESCVRYLRKKKKFKKNLIGVAGHSEGGMHTLIAATSYKKIDFIMQLSSVGTNGAQVLSEQQYLIPKQSGSSEEYSLWNQSIYDGMIAIISRNDIDQASDSLTKFLGEKYDSASEEFKSEAPKATFIASLKNFINTEWTRDFTAFETKNYLDKLDIPLFAATGEKDIQVPAKSNLEAFRNYDGAKSQVILMEGLNHLMQSCNTCGIEEYGDLEETFSAELLDLMVKWILEL